MANTFAPFGFRPTGTIVSNAVNFGYSVTPYVISSGNASPIYFGDPVTLPNTGFIVRSTAGATTIAGVFAGCTYLSTSQQRTVWSPYWPGSDAASNPTAWVVDDPNTIFLAQVGNSSGGGAGVAGGPVTQADVPSNVQFALGTANTITGYSGAYVDYNTTPAGTATLPFRLLNLLPTADIRTDNTTAGNLVLVTFNAQMFKTTTSV